MEKLRIMVASHKKCELFSNANYIPIHVGKSLSNIDLGYQGDDTGENISIKNPSYSELTAQYWGWKNLDCEYIGLCHYRRYFERKFSDANIDDIFHDIDIVLPKPMYYSSSISSKIERALTVEDEAIMFLIMKKLNPEYEKSVIKYMKGNRDIAYNMFVCRKSLFDDFCEWQFSILSECEKHVKISEYTRLKRIFGYISECLLPIYCLHNGLRIRYENIVDFIGHKPRIGFQYKKILYPLTQWHLPDSLDDMISSAVKVGLKNDGILI